MLLDELDSSKKKNSSPRLCLSLLPSSIQLPWPGLFSFPWGTCGPLG